MKQVPHENPDVWPTPLGIGLLAELDFQEKDTNLEVPGGSLFNLTSSTVRAASPGLPDELVDMFLPGGQGSLGTKIIAPESSYDYLDDELYEVIGLETPDQDNGYGELVFINDIRRIIATIPDEITDDMNLPFKPLGTRVFLEFDYDDQSVDVVDPETGETFSRADDDGEPACGCDLESPHLRRVDHAPPSTHPCRYCFAEEIVDEYAPRDADLAEAAEAVRRV